MTATRKPTAAEPVETTRRERILGWAELGLESAAAAQKQWNEIGFAYADLALQGYRNGLSMLESVYEENRKTLAALAEARSQRARAVLERLS
jgi:hypothetical protein